MSKKKLALITGASSHIGQSLAKCFANAGYDLILNATTEDSLKDLAEELKNQYKISVTIAAHDLSKSHSALKLFESLNGAEIDVLVNNAGLAVSGQFIDMSPELIMGSIHSNIESLTYLTRLVLPSMMNRRSGKILTVSSTAAFEPGPHMAVYCASEAYIVSFSEALRSELDGSGVTVTTLCPGPTLPVSQKKASQSKSRLISFGFPMDADKIAQIGFQSLMDGKSLIIPGIKNKLEVTLAKHTPRINP